MPRHPFAIAALLIGVPALAAGSALAQDGKPAAPAGQDKTPAGGVPPEAAAAMEEMGKVGENHKMLEEHLSGEWTYESKCWMNPADPPCLSSGSASVKPVMGGRFLLGDYTGKVSMPGPEGQLMDVDFVGMMVTGYDNVTKKFVNTWIDNFNTGIMKSEGSYDAATRTITYHGESPDPMQGNKLVKVRMLIRIVNKNEHVMEWYQPHDGKEAKTMEITYKRKGAAS